MNESSTSLPREWIQRLFLRMTAVYGNRFAQMWGDVPQDEVVATWADELGRFSADDIKEALAILPKAFIHYPPTLYEFADLCSDAKKRRSQSVAKLDAPRGEMPDAVRKQLRAFVETKTWR
jgi:hypothetical protein